MSKVHKRWKTLNDLTPEDDSVPTEVVHKGVIYTSAKQIADKFAESQDKKLETMRKNIEFTNFKAVNLFKRVIPRIEKNSFSNQSQLKR